MQTFTLVTPSNLEPLTGDLALLELPVRAEEPSAPGEYVGRAGGVLLDSNGSVVAFLVRLARDLAGDKPPWTLVPTSALSVSPDSALRVAWTEDQLLAQPRFDAHFDAHALVDGGAPIESRWMPARPNVVPPGTSIDGAAAVKESAAGGAIGAAIGAVAGMAVGGPLIAATLGVFFAAGGSLAGLMSGGSHDTAAQASELDLVDRGTKRSSKDARLLALESTLRDPRTSVSKALHTTQFELVVMDVPARRSSRSRS